VVALDGEPSGGCECGSRAESKRERESVRGENGGGFSTVHPRAKIRPARARGAVAATTGSVVGGVGLITGPGR
jgi:hypothetical protein